jgi:catalase
LNVLNTSKSAALLAIAGVVASVAAAFGWTAGWFTPERLTPNRLVEAFSPSGGPALGYRRNHAKGICFTGVFEANGAGTNLSKAQVFAASRYPVIGRFNLGGTDPHMADATGRVRGLGMLITTPDGRQWRSAMIDVPFFPVSTPQAFYQLLTLSNYKDPKRTAAFAAAHPEFGVFGNWAKQAPSTASFSQERYNSIDSFVFVDASGQRRMVRWAYLPAEPAVPVAVEELAKLGSDFLETDLVQQVSAGPLRFPLVVTLAAPGDPTNDPSQAWPPDRMTVPVGALIVEAVQAERDGPCRDVVFDPTVLPEGIEVSDDPFPAARSAGYARSFDERTRESTFYPYAGDGAQ